MGQKIDNLDRNIIKLLSGNARLSNRKIAAQLGFTEGTIRERVKRLEKDNFIRFTAVTSILDSRGARFFEFSARGHVTGHLNES